MHDEGGVAPRADLGHTEHPTVWAKLRGKSDFPRSGVWMDWAGVGSGASLNNLSNCRTPQRPSSSAALMKTCAHGSLRGGRPSRTARQKLPKQDFAPVV